MTFLGLDLAGWANLSTILGVVIGGAALVYSAIQLRISSRVSQAQFWLDLREMFADKHHEIHLQLRNGKWSNDDANFPTEEEVSSWNPGIALPSCNRLTIARYVVTNVQS